MKLNIKRTPVRVWEVIRTMEWSRKAKYDSEMGPVWKGSKGMRWNLGQGNHWRQQKGTKTPHGKIILCELIFKNCREGKRSDTWQELETHFCLVRETRTGSIICVWLVKLISHHRPSSGVLRRKKASSPSHYHTTVTPRASLARESEVGFLILLNVQVRMHHIGYLMHRS